MGCRRPEHCPPDRCGCFASKQPRHVGCRRLSQVAAEAAVVEGATIWRGRQERGLRGQRLRAGEGRGRRAFDNSGPSRELPHLRRPSRFCKRQPRLARRLRREAGRRRPTRAPGLRSGWDGPALIRSAMRGVDRKEAREAVWGNFGRWNGRGTCSQAGYRVGWVIVLRNPSAPASAGVSQNAQPITRGLPLCRLNAVARTGAKGVLPWTAPSCAGNPRFLVRLEDSVERGSLSRDWFFESNAEFERRSRAAFAKHSVCRTGALATVDALPDGAAGETFTDQFRGDNLFAALPAAVGQRCKSPGVAETTLEQAFRQKF